MKIHTVPCHARFFSPLVKAQDARMTPDYCRLQIETCLMSYVI